LCDLVTAESSFCALINSSNEYGLELIWSRHCLTFARQQPRLLAGSSNLKLHHVRRPAGGGAGGVPRVRLQWGGARAEAFFLDLWEVGCG
jgi:hypothetical protein